MIDTHCHLHFSAYDADRDSVISRGLDAGVMMVTVGTSRQTSADAAALAAKVDGIWASVGLHPTHLFSAYHDENESASLMGLESFDREEYRRLASLKKVVAIGECGLEYYRLPEQEADVIKEKQRQVFLEHCALATEQNLPLIIHCRDAHQDLRRILSTEIAAGRLMRRGVIHSFTGTRADAAAYIDLGFYIGVNGIVTFAKPRTGQDFLPDVIRSVPLDRIVLETDAPYLAPAPHRGERNEPANVRLIAEFVANLFQISAARIDEITTKNARKLLNIAI